MLKIADKQDSWSTILVTLCVAGSLLALPVFADTAQPSSEKNAGQVPNEPDRISTIDQTTSQPTKAPFKLNLPEWDPRPEELPPELRPIHIVRPVLPEALRKEVAELERRINELLEAGLEEDDVSAQQVALTEAIRLAEHLLDIREEHQGNTDEIVRWVNESGEADEWYEVGDARRQVEYIHQLISLTQEDRAELFKADALEQRISALDRGGKFEGAANLAAKQLHIRRRVLGANHPITLNSKGNLAVFLHSQGNLTKSKAYQLGVLAERRNVLGNGHPETLSSISNIGSVLEQSGRMIEAEAYFIDALTGRRRVLGVDHPSTLITVSNMSVLYLVQGKFRLAEHYCRAALASSRSVLGDDHPNTLATVNNLGRILAVQSKLFQARVVYSEGLVACRRLFGPNAIETLTILNNLGSLLEAQGKLSEAEVFYREALAGIKKEFGECSLYAIGIKNNMGGLLSAQGRQFEAEEFYREAVYCSRRLLGGDHYDTLSVINNVGVFCECFGNIDEAELLYREALAGRRRELGDNHPDTLNSINNMSSFLRKQGKLEEAEQYCVEALEGRRRVLGDDHLDTLRSLVTKGSLLRSQQKIGEAQSCYLSALMGFLHVLGETHSDTLVVLNNLGSLHLAEKDLSGAEGYFLRALNIAEQLRIDLLGAEAARASYSMRLNLRGISDNLARLFVQSSRFPNALTVSERGRGRALLDLLARADRDLVDKARQRVAGSGDAADGDDLVAAPLELALTGEDEARVALTTAEARLAALTKQRDAANKRIDTENEEQVAELAALEKQVTDQNKEVKAARSALADASAKVFAALRGSYPDAKPLTAEQVVKRLSTGEVALAYTWRSDAMTALTAQGGVQAGATEESINAHVNGVILAEGEEESDFRQLAQQMQAALAERSGGIDSERAARLLECLIPDSIRSQLVNAERIIVLPDGPLHGIPFEALFAAARKAPGWHGDVGWAAEPDFVYAASASMYLNRRKVGREKADGTEPSVLVIGNPIYDRNVPATPAYPEQGVLLAKVVDDSNAAQAGLTRGDVLLSYGGKPSPDYESLMGTLLSVSQQIETGERAADKRVAVTYWRDGQQRDTTLVPGKMGVLLDRGDPKLGLELMAMRSRGHEEQVAEISATDQVRLHGGTLSPLPGTQREAESIARIVKAVGGQVDLLTAEQATIGALESRVDGKRILHIATHGLTGSEERPYDASLALTQPTTPSPDDIGFLTLDHLIRKWRGKLKDCDLVVLSACDTQRGVKKGDSVMALPWGFFYAGAPTVIASLWKVDDNATQLMMTRFYENLLGVYDDKRIVAGAEYAAKTKMSKATALREAKMWVRGLTWKQLRAELDIKDDAAWSKFRSQYQSRGVGLDSPVESTPGEPVTGEGKPFEHPHYWAAFILIGDPG